MQLAVEGLFKFISSVCFEVIFTVYSELCVFRSFAIFVEFHTALTALTALTTLTALTLHLMLKARHRTFLKLKNIV